MNKLVFRVFIVAGLVVLATAAQAKTQYVSDDLTANLRRGAGTQYKITRTLKVATPVEVLDESNGWSRVKTPRGDVGFILTRFLADDAMSRSRFETLQGELAQSKKKQQEIQGKENDYKKQIAQLTTERDGLQKSKTQLEDELKKLKETAAEPLKLSRKNREYKEQIVSLENKTDRLKTEVESLKSYRKGMKIGAFILFGGIIIGLILPVFKRRKKSDFGSF